MTVPGEQELLAGITGIIAEALCIDAGTITPGSRLFLDLNAESIDVIDIRFRIEEAYSITIDQDDLMVSVGDGLSAQEVAERFTVQFIVDYTRGVLRGGRAA